MYGDPWCNDGISIRDLTLQTSPNAGLDAWGRKKPQPVLLSLSLSFKTSFTSAANQDALDSSTMHYGILSKNLLSVAPSPEWENLDGFADRVYERMLSTPPGGELVRSCGVEVFLPKGSLMGEGVRFVRVVEGSDVRRVLGLERMFIPTLIGVNDNERAAKQKLFVSIWVGGLSGEDSDSYVELERAVTKIIEPSEFETLESLAIHVLKGLLESYKPLQTSGTSIRLRLDKPQAVTHAAAPAIEIYRTSEQLKALA